MILQNWEMSHLDFMSEPLNLAQINAVIFDMDGVIVDSEPRHEQAFREIFAEIGVEQHGIHFPDYYGKSDQALWKDFIAKNEPKQTLAELSDRKQKRTIDLIREHQPLFEGMEQLIFDLSNSFDCAVASGSNHAVIDAVLGIRNIRQHFKAVVSSEDVKENKPAPDIFLRAAENLRKDPAQCCVIEDSVAGVQGALSAGMQVIAITNSVSAQELSKAHVVVESVHEIGSLLLV